MKSDRSSRFTSVAWFGAGLFLLGAMATYREDVGLHAVRGDAGYGAPGWHNVCGTVGFVAARLLLTHLGYAAFLIPLALLGEGWRQLRAAEGRPVWLRTVGILLFCATLAAVLADLFGGRSVWIPDPGGDFGVTLASLLKHDRGLGVLGGRIALAVLFLLTFVLYADLLYAGSAESALRWFDARGGLLAALPWWGRRSAPARRPTKRRAKGASDDEEDDDDEKDERSAASRAELDAALDVALGVRRDPDEDDEEDGAERPARRRSRKKAPAANGKTTGEDDDEAPERAAADEGDDEDDDEEAAKRTGKDGAEPAAPLFARLLGKGKPARGSKKAAVEAEEEAEAEKPAPPARKGPIPLIVQAKKAPPAMTAKELQQPEPPSLKSLKPYKFPPLDLLDAPKKESSGDFLRFTEEVARKLTAALRSFKVEANVVGVQRGPSITMLEIELAAGTKLTRLRALEDDLAMALAAQSVRIVAPIPGKSTAGIEIPNETREVVRMSELLQAQAYNPSKFAIPIFLGKDSAGVPRIEDLARAPHLLVAGSTGSGKSVCLNTLIMSILYTRSPEQVRMILIDPKMVELSTFQNVPHLMCPVVTDMKRAAGILEWATDKMEERYALLHKVGVRNIYAYNKLGDEECRKRLGEELGDDFETTLPFIVIVMDEIADLMLVHGKDVEQSITRLAQKSRAVGIHVIMATQRPSTNVITGLIKANLPTRIGFRVTSKIDSRVILDQNGADKLLGQGDMLYVPPGSADLSRVQGCFVTDQEIKSVVEFLAQHGAPEYSRELIQRKSTTDAQDPAEQDELYDEAAKFIVETQRGSASLLQRRFAIGYTRASRLIDLMAADGILGDFKGSQAREVNCASLEELEKRRAESRAAHGGAAPRPAAAALADDAEGPAGGTDEGAHEETEREAEA
ncbi:MAG TPA: DNA translocase FtsK [Planctomycetota bacterium]|nr:DNA translocase FtsK [Planctomycetota bacterium]